jgi:hypothetical protein
LSSGWIDFMRLALVVEGVDGVSGERMDWMVAGNLDLAWLRVERNWVGTDLAHRAWGYGV